MLLQIGVVVLVVGTAAGLAFADARSDAEDVAAQRTRGLALVLADAPEVRQALDDEDPTARLQPYAERVRVDAGVDFVVVMSPERTRYSHPNVEQIGGQYIGTVAPALAGETFTETFTGTLGPSVRTVTPVWSDEDGSGEVLGLVSVGITIEAVGADLRRNLPGLLLAAAGVLALALIGAALVTRRLHRLTYGLGAEELGRMYGYYDAVLHSVREGLLLVDADHRVQLVNDEARRLLALDDASSDPVGRKVEDLGLPGDLAGAMVADRQVTDELYVARDRVLAVNVAAVAAESGRAGRVVTVRDRTDLQELTGELDTARGLAEALRSQAHEAANRLHAVVSLVELGRTDEAVDFAVEELQAAQSLTDQVIAAVDEPVVAALLLGKSAVAAERGLELVVEPGTELDAGTLHRLGLPARDLVTVLGNLLDNAIDAASAVAVGASRNGRGQVRVLLTADEGRLQLRVADTGPGLDSEAARHAFERGWSTKPAESGRPHGRGLGLALVGQVVHRHGGTVEVYSGDDGGAVFEVRVPVPEGVSDKRGEGR